MANALISVADFNAILDQFAGRQVAHYAVTLTTSNISGHETATYAASATLKAYFMKYKNPWDFQKAGFIEKGDAVMLAKAADGVKKDDRVVVDTETYKVREAFNVPGTFDSTGSGTTAVYTACNLWLET